LVVNGQATMIGPATSGIAPVPRPRRPLRTRLASGHLLMILAGVLTFVLVANALRARNATVEVAVAVADVAPGAVLSPASIRISTLPASSSLRDSLVAPEVLGAERWVATRRIAAGEPLLRSALAHAAAPNGLRAMSVPVSPDHAAGGELNIGDRVDVISADGPQALYVVRNAEVIGVAPRRGSAGLSSSSTGQFYVTIAVEADPALRLAAAIRAGKLEVLRSTGAEAR
jgi:Flp pilus assembly protein CpaB